MQDIITTTVIALIPLGYVFYASINVGSREKNIDSESDETNEINQTDQIDQIDQIESDTIFALKEQVQEDLAANEVTDDQAKTKPSDEDKASQY